MQAEFCGVAHTPRVLVRAVARVVVAAGAEILLQSGPAVLRTFLVGDDDAVVTVTTMMIRVAGPLGFRGWSGADKPSVTL